MKLCELSSDAPLGVPKAGIVPFLSNGLALFAVSSDVKFGGDKPAIAKGEIDKGETPIEAGIREGEEELGLLKTNFTDTPFLCWHGKLSGLDATYTMHVYAVQVNDKGAFGPHDFETSHTVWMSREDFNSAGRSSQRHIANVVFNKIDEQLKR